MPNTTDHRRGIGRALLTACVCLILGLATTLGIAWGSAGLVDVSQGAGIVAIDGDHLQPWLIRISQPSAQRTIWFEKGRIYNKQGVGPPGGSGAAVACWSFATGTRNNPRFTKGPL